MNAEERLQRSFSFLLDLASDILTAAYKANTLDGVPEVSRRLRHKSPGPPLETKPLTR